MATIRFPHRKKSPVNPKASEGQKRRLQDPEYREKLVQRLRDYKALPKHKRYFRDGVPDGMRKPEARRRWLEAKATAKRIHTHMVEDGTVAPLPEDYEGSPEPFQAREDVEAKVAEEVKKLSDEQMASAALQAAMTTILSPYGDAKLKQQAINTVLTFTKAKPATKIDAKFSNAEAWLEQVAQDAKS